MHKRKYLLSALFVLAAVHIAVAAGMIYQYEHTLRTGAAYRFQTEPVDPYDAFRGRYVTIRVDRQVPAAARFSPGQRVYAAIRVNPDGFAVFSKAYPEPPANAPYVETTVDHYRPDKNRVRIRIPFDRYYMNEKMAPAAERAYRMHSRTDKREAHVKVRVKDGFAALEELYVDGKPIAAFLAAGGEQGRNTE